MVYCNQGKSIVHKPNSDSCRRRLDIFSFNPTVCITSCLRYKEASYLWTTEASCRTTRSFHYYSTHQPLSLPPLFMPSISKPFSACFFFLFHKQSQHRSVVFCQKPYSLSAQQGKWRNMAGNNKDLAIKPWVMTEAALCGLFNKAFFLSLWHLCFLGWSVLAPIKNLQQHFGRWHMHS